MSFKLILKTAERFVTNNTPGILTGLGVAGAITTAVLTGKATLSAHRIVLEDREPYRNLDGSIDDDRKLSNSEIAKLVWKEFIPPAVVGTATITAIIAANRVGSRRAATIAAAFKISEQMAEEYKQKVIQSVGKKAEEKLQTELAADRMERTNPSDRQAIIVCGSESVFFDQFAGRYFKADMEKVRQAVNEINHQVNNYFCASLTDFYDKLNLPKTEMSDMLGWNTDELLEVSFYPVLMDDQRPAIGMSYNKTPIQGYDRVQ